MAKIIDVWRSEHPVELPRRQLPMIVDESLTMIVDLSQLKFVNESPLLKGKKVNEFIRKYDMLTEDEVMDAFEVTHDDVMSILNQDIPCIGCRRSVEKLFYDLMDCRHEALDPLTVTTDGLLTVSDEVLESPRRLYTILDDHSTRLNRLLAQQQRSKTSNRCALHSLEVHRTRPPPNAWKEAWDVMEITCREEVTLVEYETLESALESYLRKHRFCAECRTRVLLASSLLTTSSEPTREKGYVPALYAGIKRCINEHHVHLPSDTEYVQKLIGKALSDIVGRERHAKSLDVAQEEVLICLGICVADRLNRIYRRLKDEVTTCNAFAAVALDALWRNFEKAVEKKQGVTRLELLCQELCREESAKQQKREKLRLRRKRKKERRQENIEEKENTCNCSKKKDDENNKCTCARTDSKPTTQNNDRHKLQVLDPKNKGQPTCKCPDCQKKSKDSNTTTKTPNIVSPGLFRSKKSPKKATLKNEQKRKEKKNDEINLKDSLKVPDDHETCLCCEKFAKKHPDGEWHHRDGAKTPPTQEEILKWANLSKSYDIKMAEVRASSEPLSHDYGYSSERISSPSMPSTPEGSEAACSESWCSIEDECSDTHLPEKFDNSSIDIILFLGQTGPTLTEMLEDSHLSDDDEIESHISIEEMEEFRAQNINLHEKRLKLRQRLQEHFAKFCNQSKLFFISR